MILSLYSFAHRKVMKVAALLRLMMLYMT
jgi:hypothetical protein